MYILIELSFVALVALASLRISTLASYTPAMLVALLVLGSFASLRMARTISYNAVCAWLRKPFTHVVPDSSGAGDSVEPKPGNVLGELLACPICTGTWSALVLVNLVLWVPSFGQALVLVLGLAGVSECLHWRAERDEWQGRHARELSGTEWMIKNHHP